MKARCPRCTAPLPVVGVACLKCAKLRAHMSTRLACVGLVFVVLCIGAVVAQVWRIRNRPPLPEATEEEEFTRDLVGAPPALVDSAIFVPRFLLRDGSTGSGGHAFVASHPALPGPLVFSTLGLLGPVLDLPAQVEGATVGDELSRLWLRDPVSGQAVADVGSAGISLPGTAPLGEASQAGDVLACWPPLGVQLGVLPLTSRLTQRGSIVWLAGLLEDDGELVLTPARLIEMDEQGFLRYEFAEAIDPSVPVGAPLLDQTGVVVAIHAGGGVGRGHDGRPDVPFGLGTAIGTFIRPLVRAVKAATPPPVSAAVPLAESRAATPPAVTRRASPPQRSGAVVAPAGAVETTYRSGDLALPAWVTPDPSDGRRRPAVLWLHGGFAFGAGDWDDAAPLRAAGYAVLAPRLRGENGAPGHFECFGGELDDALAAGRHLAALPWVDPERVFVAGHSVGGTLATLCCMVPSPFRAGASLSGAGRLAGWLSGQLSIAPFDLTDPRQLLVRDPWANHASVTIPLRLYAEGDGSPHTAGIAALARAAAAAGRPVEHRAFEGTDHGTLVEPALRDAAQWFAGR